MTLFKSPGRLKLTKFQRCIRVVWQSLLFILSQKGGTPISRFSMARIKPGRIKHAFMHNTGGKLTFIHHFKAYIIICVVIITSKQGEA
jgi:hypothetical protein